MLLGHAESGLVSFSDILSLLVAVELDVTVAGEVWADTTMGSVSSSATGDSALDNNVVDDAGVNIKFGSLGVGLEVFKELFDSVKRLLGPSTLGVLECFTLGVTSNTTSVPSEGNDRLLLEAQVHVLDGSLQLHTFGGTSDFVSVLVVGT